MKRYKTIAVMAALFVASGCCVGLSDDFIVSLHASSSTVNGTTVRLSDVATIAGATPAERRQLQQLDLESLADQDDCIISRKQIEMRLLLAGYRRDSFAVTGPSSVVARRSEPARLRLQLEQKIGAELASQFAIDADRVFVRLSDNAPWTELESKLSSTEFSIQLLPRNEFPIGRTRLPVTIINDRQDRHSESFDAHVALLMEVAIAGQPISQGTVVTAGMVQMVERQITTKADYANPHTAVGRIASRYIPSNTVVLASHLITPRAGSGDVVKRNDLLDVVIKFGNGEIRLKDARAMAAGKIGDTIEVLNPQTNRSISASIIGPKLATVTTMMHR